MTDYLQHPYDLRNPETVSIFDELSLWAARFGLMLLNHVEIRRGIRILDVGCGLGFPLIELAQVYGRSCRVTGLDPWQEALMRARLKLKAHHLPNARVVQADGAHQPFHDSAFDLIVSNLGINNFADAPAVLAECYRVAKPNATIALTSNLTGHMSEFYEVFRQTLIDLHKAQCLEKLGVNEAHRGTKASICALLEQAGFRIVRLVEDQFQMRYLDGSALLNHSLTRVGFLDSWRRVVGPADERAVFELIESRLNEIAEQQGELRMTVPMLYVEAQKTV